MTDKDTDPNLPEDGAEPEQFEAHEGYTIKPPTIKPPTPTEHELTSFESFELAEINDEQQRAMRASQQADHRMGSFLRTVLRRCGVTGTDADGWMFHVDADAKRVVVRKQDEPVG